MRQILYTMFITNSHASQNIMIKIVDQDIIKFFALTTMYFTIYLKKIIQMQI